MLITRIFSSIERRSEGRRTALSACLAIQLLFSLVLGLMLDPGGESFVLAFSVVGCLAMLIVVLFMPQANRVCLWVLLAASVIMTVGAWINITGYTHDDFTLASPDFNAGNPFDSWREYEYAKYILNEHHLVNGGSGNNAYPLLVCALFTLLGVNIIWPIALNMGFILGSIILAGSICAKLMPDYGRRHMTMCGMILAACISSILMHGTLLLKDAPVIFGVSLFAYSMALTIRHQFGTRAIMTAVCAALVLLFSRPSVALFLLLGVILLIPRYSKQKRTFEHLSPAIFYALLLMVVLMAMRSLMGIEANTDALTSDNSHFTATILDLPSVQKFGSLVEGYYEWPLWKRVLILPFTCAAMYFPPFPWNFTRDLWMGNFYWFAHLNFGWYLVGGLIIAYYLFCWFRKSGHSRLNIWAIWILLCYIGIAFYCAGTVSRYFVPFIPAAIPLAVCVAYQVYNGIIQRRSFVVYSAVYLVLLAVGLVSAYIFLKL